MKINDYKIPSSPGVYHFLDEKGGLLYIGKAKNLKNRLKQYYQKELNRGPWIEEMMKIAADIRWIETDSEIEAVILEAELIGKLKPKFNIKLKDDKSFLVIKITKEDIPCVTLERFKNIDKNDKSAQYFGPYPSGDLLKKSLRYLRRIFPFRDCSVTKYRTYTRKMRPCMYADINVCSGPCCDLSSKDQYAKNISYLKKFLKGGKKSIIDSLEKEMAAMSRKKEYEKAVTLRNRITALNHLKDVAIGLKDEPFDASRLLFKRIECYDISNLLDNFAVGSMVVFENGKPNKDEYRKFRIRDDRLEIAKEPTSDLGRLKQVLERRFQNDWPRPDLIIIDGGEMQLRVAKEVLKQLNFDIPAISISKGAKRDKNDFHYSASDIAKYFLANRTLENIAICARDESHRFAIAYYRSLHLKEMFK